MPHTVSLSDDQKALLKRLAVRTNDFILLASIVALGVFALWVVMLEGRV